MTICVRERFSTTRSLCVSPTLSWLALSTIAQSPLAPFHRTFGRDADAAGGNDKLTILVAIFRNPFAKRQLARPLALALPCVPLAMLHREYVTRPQWPVILEVLFGMQPATA